MDHEARHQPTGDDQGRQQATTTDSIFTLSIDEALERYARAGHPRTPRSIQRYCAKGHLDGRLIETPFGEKWLITAESVDRHVAYIDEVTPPTGHDKDRQAATTGVDEGSANLQPQEPATSRDVSRQVVTSHDKPIHEIPIKESDPIDTEGPRQGSTGDDQSPYVATRRDSDRYVSRLESENEFLRGQVSVKDGQIKDLTERARETNHLIGGLQRMLSPLLGSSERHDDDQTNGQTARL